MDPASFNIRFQAKSLEREARKAQKESIKERNKAKNELKKGNRANAGLYAQNACRMDQQANLYLRNASAAQGYAADIRQAQITNEMSKTMNEATKAMGKTAKTINLEKMSENRYKMDNMRQRLGAANDLLTCGEGQMDLNAGADNLLAQLDQELAISAIEQIGDIPTGQPIMTQPGAYPNLNF